MCLGCCWWSYRSVGLGVGVARGTGRTAAVGWKAVVAVVTGGGGWTGAIVPPSSTSSMVPPGPSVSPGPLLFWAPPLGPP